MLNKLAIPTTYWVYGQTSWCEVPNLSVRSLYRGV